MTSAKSMAAWRENLGPGRCKTDGKPTTGQRRYCDECNEKSRLRMKALRARRRAEREAKKKA